jgi:hypothetical protein
LGFLNANSIFAPFQRTFLRKKNVLPSILVQFQVHNVILQRKTGEPLRAFIQLEASRKPSGAEDIFISYHSSSDVQATYAGKTFRIVHSYHVAKKKRDVLSLVLSNNPFLG